MQYNSSFKYLFSISLKFITRSNMAKKFSTDSFQHLLIEELNSFVKHVKLNRPTKRNALNKVLWLEIGKAFDQLAEDENCRAIVLSGEGEVFSAGIDLQDFAQVFMQTNDLDTGRKGFFIRKLVENYQKSFTALEACPKPVIAAVNGPCVGGGVDLISAADIRYCTQTAWFQVKEVDVGLAADVGTLQRLPKAIGSSSLARELCLTGRKMYADEALSCGFVNRVFPTKQELISAAVEIASKIAEKSPIAVQGTKLSMNYSRDHGVQDGLDHVRLWNQTMLQSEDLLKAATSLSNPDQKPIFSKL